jgi:hypothetical protein
MTGTLHAIAHVAGAAYVAIAVLAFVARLPLVLRIVRGAWGKLDPPECPVCKVKHRRTVGRAMSYTLRAFGLALLCSLLWFVPGRRIVDAFTST